MCTYLSKRDGGTYYFRRPIPAELRPLFGGRLEWIKTLRTKDRDAAKRMIPLQTIETDKAITEARARLADSEPSPVEARRRATVPDWQLPDPEQDAYESRELNRREAKREQLEPAIAFLEQRLRGSTANMPDELRAVRYLLDDREYDRRLLKDRVAVLRGKLADLNDKTAGDTAKAASAAVPPVPMLATFEAYAKAQGITPGVASEWGSAVRRFSTFTGHDDARRFTTEDVVRWRDALASEPSSRGKPRAAATVKKMLGAISATLAWAKEERRVAENVATGVVVRTPRQVRLREREFTPAEAKAILSATLRPAGDHISAEHAVARRWVPWLCAYTGARVGEITQLRAQDVKEIEGVWTIRITPEAGTVKDKTARIVPLHPHLLEQGFLDVACAKEGPLFYDPGRQRAQSLNTRRLKKTGERIAIWVRNEVGITDPNIKPNHAFRHLWKHLSIAAEIPERVADAIQGHAPRSVGQSYGSVPIKTMADAIAKLPRFEVERPG